MDIKRFLTAIIGFPLVMILLIFGNKYIIDACVAIIAIIAMHEYTKCATNKDIKIISWIRIFSTCLYSINSCFTYTSIWIS